MEKNMIVAEMVQSNKSNNQVWFVHVTGVDNPELQGYCKQALAALRLAFILKRRTGFSIAEQSLKCLMQLHQLAKQPAEQQQPEASTSVPAEAPEEEVTPKQRKAKRTKKQEAAQ